MGHNITESCTEWFIFFVRYNLECPLSICGSSEPISNIRWIEQSVFNKVLMIIEENGSHQELFRNKKFFDIFPWNFQNQRTTEFFWIFLVWGNFRILPYFFSNKEVKCEIQFYVDPKNFMQKYWKTYEE